MVTRKTTPGLDAAYVVADEALEFHLDLNHWKAALVGQTQQLIVIYSGDDLDDDFDDNLDNDLDDDLDDDEELRLAIKMSLEDVRTPDARSFPTPSTSRARHEDAWQNFLNRVSLGSEPSLPVRPQVKPPLPPRRRAPSPSILPTPTPSPTIRSNLYTFSSQSSKRARSSSTAFSDDELPSLPRRTKLSPGNRRPNLGHDPQRPACKPSNAVPTGLSASQLFFRNGPNASASRLPDDDVIEEEL